MLVSFKLMLTKKMIRPRVRAKLVSFKLMLTKKMSRPRVRAKRAFRAKSTSLQESIFLMKLKNNCSPGALTAREWATLAKTVQP